MILKLLNKIVTGWEVEYKFHPARRWRFDFSNPRLKIAVEIEGGAFIRGRHTRGAGFVKDMEKYNNAVLLGWRVLRYTPQQVGEMMANVKELTFMTEYKIRTCGECKATSTMRASGICKECEEKEVKWDGADGV